MPFKDFQDDEILYASDVDLYLMRQAVMIFTNSGARGSAIGTAVAEGMLTYLTANDVLEYYNGSSWNNIIPSSFNASIIQNTLTSSTATSYTISSSDQSKVLQFTGGTTTITVSTATAFVAGERVDIVNDTPSMTITAGSGVTFRSANSTASSVIFDNQYDAATILCVSANNYRIIGAISNA